MEGSLLVFVLSFWVSVVSRSGVLHGALGHDAGHSVTLQLDAHALRELEGDELVAKIDDLAEQARKRLGMYFVKEYEVDSNKLVSMTLDPKLEQILVQRVKKSQFDVGLAMDPDLTQGLIEEIVPKIDEMSDQGLNPCLVTTSDLRLALRRFLEPSYPQLSIFAYQEIPSETMVEPFASITLPQFSIPENFSPIPGEATAGDTDLAANEPQLVS